MKFSFIAICLLVNLFLLQSHISAEADSTLYVNALAKYESHKYQTALDILKKINLDNISKDLRRDALFLNGKIQYNKRNYDDAIEKIESAILYDKEGIVINDYRNFKNKELIGYTFYMQSKHTLTIKYLKEALSILDVVKEEDYDNYIDNLVIIASSYSDLGYYSEADNCFKKVYEYIFSCKNSYDHKQHCKVLFREASSKYEADEYEHVENKLSEAQRIFELNNDTLSDYYFQVISKKGSLYRRYRKFDLALKFYMKAYNHSKQNPDNTSHAWNARRVALTHRYLRDYKMSEIFYKEAISIFKKRKNNIQSRHFLNIIAEYSNLNYEMGQENKAIEYLLESLEVLKAVFKEEEEESKLVYTHATLGKMYRGTHKPEKALHHYKECIRILEKTHDDEHNSLHNKLDDIALTLLKLEKHSDADFYYSRYYKALKPRIKEQIKHLSDEDFINVSMTYEDELDELKYLIHHPAYDQNKWAKNVYNIILLFRTILLEDRNQILGNTSQNIDKTAIIDISFEDIQSALNQEDVAIEFYDYRDREEDCTIICALILNNKSNGPIHVSLFEIDDFGNRYQTSTYGKLLEKDTLEAEINNKLNEHLPSRIANVYYSLSKSLYKMKFDLSDLYDDRHSINFHQLFSTRNIIKIKDKQKQTNKNLLAVGNINYDTTSSSTTNKSWSDLKYADIEIELINDYCSKSNDCAISTVANKEAQEKAICRILNNHDNNILHFATHGFYNERIDTTNKSSLEGINFRHSKNSLGRCGILLTNGNHTWQTNRTYTDDYDGILTGTEISNLKLNYTDLVVLSSCDSGIGDVNDNEGVFGLQRAFKMAGVKNLIVSTDKVSDLNSMKFMNYFYKEFLIKEKNIHDSFYSAKKLIKANIADPNNIPKFILIES